ncbi:MAG: nuclear transport factor 2 family protein [Acidobacteria bacterium]|nr:nuclear transport factor 2 family protein [Acidobacteriota bacterium]
MKNIFLMFVVTFAFAGYAFGECNQADKKALEAFDHAWSVAGDNGDRAALTNILADDFTGLPAMINKTQSIDGTMRAFERNKANPQNKDQVSSDLFMISCTPATATITHRNVVTTKNGTGGKKETFYSRSVHFLEKRGGKWQAVSSANHSLDDYGVLMYMEHDWSNAYHTKGRDEKGQPFDRRIRYTDTYIKRDGHWQAWASQGTLIP